jgi:hypothetical protein
MFPMIRREDFHIMKEKSSCTRCVGGDAFWRRRSFRGDLRSSDPCRIAGRLSIALRAIVRMENTVHGSAYDEQSRGRQAGRDKREDTIRWLVLVR